MFDPSMPIDTDFTEFPITAIKDNSVTDFDIYLRLKDQIILYAGHNYHWLKDELNALLRHGYDMVLVRRADVNKARIYEQIAKLPELNQFEPPSERIVSIQQVGFQFTRCLYEGDITPACVNKAKEIAQAIENCVSEDRTCIKELRGLADHDYYTYYHSIRVATYAVAIAIEMGLSESEKIHEIGLGGIFHDIGKKDVGLDIVNKSGALSESEWVKMRAHPIYGYDSLKESILSFVPQEIILHHHEKLDGSGYPHGIQRSEILTEVQIATVADIFDALTSARSYQQKRSRFEALDFLKNRMIGQKLPVEAFRALISCLK